jgi:hypothetical protein
VQEKSRNSGVAQSKSAISNLELPLAKNNLNLATSDEKTHTAKLHNFGKTEIVGQQKAVKEKENKGALANNSKNSKVAGYLMLDDLDKVYKKLPGLDRLEVRIDFSSQFKSILKL